MPGEYEYVVVVIETESDTPGVEYVYGPFEYEVARTVQENIRGFSSTQDDLVQVSLMTRLSK